MSTLRLGLLTMATLTLAGLMSSNAAAQPNKPNILIIWGDDIGMVEHRGRPTTAA